MKGDANTGAGNLGDELRDEAAEISARLRERAAEVAMSLLGEPTFTKDGVLRWGSKGSLRLTTTGEKRGVWHDFETGTGGDMLALVSRTTGDMPKAAFDWARRYLGLPVRDEKGRLPKQAQKPARAPAPRPALAPSPDANNARREARRLQLLRTVWQEAVPIAHTPAETYLHRRGIRLRHWPADLRFHPACPRGADRLPALVVVMRDPITGEGVGLQRIFLAADGSDRLRDAMGKAMLGNAGVMMLTPSAEVTHGLHLAEGPENGLAALAIRLAPAWCAASAGGIARFPVLAGIECLTILADADGAGMRAAETCAARWREAGREVRILAPVRDGADMNDVAREIAA
jgi:hypothetical protein